MPEWPNGQGRGPCGLVPTRVRTSSPAFMIIQRKMTKRTGPTNPVLVKIINELKKASLEQGVRIWKRVALDLEKSTRSRRVVNLSKISRFTKEAETIVIPGKVLGSGALSHKLNISAFQFSEGAKEKIEKSGSKIIHILDLAKESPKGKRIRIIG